MKANHPRLIDVLAPIRFEDNPKRAQVTRTIRQPEIDALEMLEALPENCRSAKKSGARSAKR